MNDGVDTPRYLEWAYLGRVPYEDALRQQHERRDGVLRGEEAPLLMLLEHEPTVTLGRRGSISDLRLPPEELAARGVRVIETDRGGLATYHGPGQLVGYPIVQLRDLRLGTRDYVHRLAEALESVLRAHGILADWYEDEPGLWVRGAKIASFGIHVHAGVTTHGFALNVQPELSAFDMIVPCGKAETAVTSMAATRGELWSLEALAGEVAEEIASVLALRARPWARRPPPGPTPASGG